MLTAITQQRLNERRREMAILRSVGARPAGMYLRCCCLGSCQPGTGASFWFGLLYLGLWIGQPLDTLGKYGYLLPLRRPR